MNEHSNAPWTQEQVASLNGFQHCGMMHPFTGERKYREMTMEKLFSLKPGDQYRVYWCKDDNPEYLRFDYAIQTVVEINDEYLWADDHNEWRREGIISLDSNGLDTSRGIASFFEVDDETILIATTDGWVEREGGPVVQTWAHQFMADGSWRTGCDERDAMIASIKKA